MKCIRCGPRRGDVRPLAVVTAIHGDEPCGVQAIHRLLDSVESFMQPVTFVIANERALEMESRFIDTDLNRAFPGHPKADLHERRLAARLLETLEGHDVVSVHSTTSIGEPFALIQRETRTTRSLARAAGVDHVVDISFVDGGLEDHVEGIAVECGIKGSEAAVETAVSTLENILTWRGALPGPANRTSPRLYRVTDRVEGGDLQFVGENFTPVSAGDVFARRPVADSGVDSEAVRATEDFTPVLMSSDGYDDILGFAATRCGEL